MLEVLNKIIVIYFKKFNFVINFIEIIKYIGEFYLNLFENNYSKETVYSVIYNL